MLPPRDFHAVDTAEHQRLDLVADCAELRSALLAAPKRYVSETERLAAEDLQGRVDTALEARKARLAAALEAELEADDVAAAGARGLLERARKVEARRRELRLAERRADLRRVAGDVAGDVAATRKTRDDMAAAVEGARGRALGEHVAQAEERDRRKGAASAAAEAARINELRFRDLQLVRERHEVQIAADVKRRVWREKALGLLALERDAAEYATAKERALHSLVSHHRELRTEASYGELRRLQAQFEAHAQEIEAHLGATAAKHGTALNALMGAARETAAKARKDFPSLSLLRAATFVPTVFTTAADPRLPLERRVRSVGLQTKL